MAAYLLLSTENELFENNKSLQYGELIIQYGTVFVVREKPKWDNFSNYFISFESCQNLDS